ARSTPTLLPPGFHHRLLLAPEGVGDLKPEGSGLPAELLEGVAVGQDQAGVSEKGVGHFGDVQVTARVMTFAVVPGPPSTPAGGGARSTSARLCGRGCRCRGRRARRGASPPARPLWRARRRRPRCRRHGSG